MIVVIGSSSLLGEGSTATPDGLANRIALAAAAAGAAVEVVAKIGDDPDGDALLVALARAGVGHVAMLREAAHLTTRYPAVDDVAIEAALDLDPEAEAAPSTATPDPAAAPTLDAADVRLALRYLIDYRVIVAVHQPDAVVAEAVGAADWVEAHLLLVTAPGQPVPAGLPPGALVLEAADELDDVTALGERLGRYAAAVDGGTAPATAYAALTAEG